MKSYNIERKRAAFVCIIFLFFIPTLFGTFIVHIVYEHTSQAG